MTLKLRAAVVASALLVAIAAGGTASAQKPGGILKMYSLESPPSMSILEEATPAAQSPMMGVFNNLIMFDQQVKQNSLASIAPDLATSWSWNEDGTALTLPLRQGVKWHDGKPFTAKDVQCTWDLLMDAGSEKLRFNPRKSFHRNIERVSTNGDYEVTFYLKRPQPAFPMLLAIGFSAIYPCHVSPRDMRQHPIGTGPFKFVEFKPNEHIKVTQSGLLEAGSPLSRRRRVHDLSRSGDGHLGVHCRKVRHDFFVHPLGPAAEGRAEPGAAGALRTDTR